MKNKERKERKSLSQERLSRLEEVAKKKGLTFLKGSNKKKGVVGVEGSAQDIIDVLRDS